MKFRTRTVAVGVGQEEEEVCSQITDRTDNVITSGPGMSGGGILDCPQIPLPYTTRQEKLRGVSCVGWEDDKLAFEDV